MLDGAILSTVSYQTISDNKCSVYGSNLDWMLTIDGFDDDKGCNR